MGLNPTDCDRPTLYVLVYTHRSTVNVIKGWRVKTCPIAPKPPLFSKMKSVEYLTNTLALLDAHDDGFDQGIFVDHEGVVTEGPNMNVAMVTQEDELVVAPFDHALSGLTMQRVMEIVPQVCLCVWGGTGVWGVLWYVKECVGCILCVSCAVHPVAAVYTA